MEAGNDGRFAFLGLPPKKGSLIFCRPGVDRADAFRHRSWASFAKRDGEIWCCFGRTKST